MLLLVLFFPTFCYSLFLFYSHCVYFCWSKHPFTIFLLSSSFFCRFIQFSFICVNLSFSSCPPFLPFERPTQMFLLVFNIRMRFDVCLFVCSVFTLFLAIPINSVRKHKYGGALSKQFKSFFFIYTDDSLFLLSKLDFCFSLLGVISNKNIWNFIRRGC